MSDAVSDSASDSVSDGTRPQAWSEQTFTLAEYPEKLAIVKLGPGAEIPTWAESSSLFSVTATASVRV